MDKEYKLGSIVIMKKEKRVIYKYIKTLSHNNKL